MCMCMSVWRVHYTGQHSVPVGHYLRLLLLLILGITSAALNGNVVELCCLSPPSFFPRSSLLPLTSVPYPLVICPLCYFLLFTNHPPCSGASVLIIFNISDIWTHSLHTLYLTFISMHFQTLVYVSCFVFLISLKICYKTVYSPKV